MLRRVMEELSVQHIANKIGSNSVKHVRRAPLRGRPDCAEPQL